jgi:hypothetical protein
MNMLENYVRNVVYSQKLQNDKMGWVIEFVYDR